MTDLIQITQRQARDVERLRFGPLVAYVYNPLVYARRPLARFLEKFGRSPREVLLVGMNPGPFGMAQTGIPFGEVTFARDWLGVAAPAR